MRTDMNAFRCIHQTALRARIVPRKRFGRLLVYGDGDVERQLFGENFGARDPFAAEVESNFCEKVLGNFDTEHIIKAPDSIGAVLGLTAKSCGPQHAATLTDRERERLRNQIPGWRVTQAEAGGTCLRNEWTAKDAGAAEKLRERLANIAQAEGHRIQLDCSDVYVTAVLNSESTEGLSTNDFIVAAKINAQDLKPMLKRKAARFWA